METKTLNRFNDYYTRLFHATLALFMITGLGIILYLFITEGNI